jgi:cytochrome b561
LGKTQPHASTAVALHRLLAIFLGGMHGVGWYTLPIEGEPGSSRFFTAHKSIGIAVLALVAWRLTWCLGGPPAPLRVNVPAWQARASKASRRLLQAAMLTMPQLALAGWHSARAVSGSSAARSLALRRRIAIWLRRSSPRVSAAVVLVSLSLASVVLHAARHLRKPMDLPAWQGANRSNAGGIARICNAATGAKTRCCVPHSVPHHTSA